MILKCVKYGGIAVLGAGLVGGVFFGQDLVSYVRSSAKSVRTAVKDSVPIEFELQRARDMVEQIIPELHANIRLIAQEEVEIAALKRDIEHSTEKIGDERKRIARLRAQLEQPEAVYTVHGRRLTRQQVREDLARRFELFREASDNLAGKRRLLQRREEALVAAMQMLERARHQKGQLEHQIESLVAQHRLLQAASAGSRIHVDDSKLAQAQKLIGQIKKRLDVAERVLAHEARFTPIAAADPIDEGQLLAEVDDYF